MNLILGPNNHMGPKWGLFNLSFTLLSLKIVKVVLLLYIKIEN